MNAKVNRANPYSLAHPWSEETRAAYAAMPKYRGYVQSLHFTADRDVPAMEGEWREWCKRHPRVLWPTWLDNWKDAKRLRGIE